MVRIWIRMVRSLFNVKMYAFECLESLSSGSNLRSNDGIWLEWFEFVFECFESLSNGCFRMLQISFEWLHSNASNLNG